MKKRRDIFTIEDGAKIESKAFSGFCPKVSLKVEHILGYILT